MKKRVKKRKRNNAGLTLIEMIVTVAIIAIFSGVVVTVITVGANFYRGVSSNTKVQSEIQEIQDELENRIMNTNEEISCSSSGTSTTLVMKSREEDGESTEETTETMTWDQTAQKIYLTRTGKDPVSNAVFAENVSLFSVDTSKAVKEGTVGFELTVTLKGKTISTSSTVTLRNRLKDSSSANDDTTE